MEVFIYAISLLLSLIVLIRFFQISSNISSIKKSVEEYVNPNFHFLFHNGYRDKAKDVLLKNIWNTKEMNAMRVARNMNDFEKNYSVLKNQYEHYFKMLGEEFPAYESLRETVGN